MLKNIQHLRPKDLEKIIKNNAEYFVVQSNLRWKPPKIQRIVGEIFGVYYE